MSSASQFGTLITVDGVAPVAGNIAFTSTGGTIIITPRVGTINFEAVGGGGGGITTIDGDVGSVTGATITLTGGTSGAVFTGSGTTMTESFNFLSLPDSTSSALGVINIGGEPFMHAFPGTADSNTFLGFFSGNFTGIASSCVAIGSNSGESFGNNNQCVALGVDALNLSNSGSYNTSIGGQSLLNLRTGDFNIAVGGQSGSNLTGSESNNIYIGSTGVVGESNVMRLGIGTANSDPTTAYIAGVFGNTPSGTAQVMFVDTNGIMSSAASAGGGIVTIDGDSGSVTGTTVTLTGGTSGAVFTGSGATVTMSFNDINLPATTASTTGVITIDGNLFMHNYGGTADQNTFLGMSAGGSTFTNGLSGNANTCIGNSSGIDIQGSASGNTLIGGYTGYTLQTGNFNTVIGYNAGSSYSGAETQNILLGSFTGVVGESNTMHLGDNGNITSTYIGGIFGNTPSGTAQVAYVDTNGLMSSAASASPASRVSLLAYNSSGQIVPGASTATIVFDTSTFDTGSNFNTGTSTFTAPTTAIYQFHVNVGAVPASTTDTVGLLVNGTPFSLNINATVVGTAADVGINIILNLTAADAVTVVYNNASVATNATILGQAGPPTNPYITWFSCYQLT